MAEYKKDYSPTQLKRDCNNLSWQPPNKLASILGIPAKTRKLDIVQHVHRTLFGFEVTNHVFKDSGDLHEIMDGLEDAYQLALNVSSQRALSRFQRLGRPLVMAADKKPTPPAGPWWIWNYLSYTDKSSEVRSSLCMHASPPSLLPSLPL